MRADAHRNRNRLVEVAREVFREQGYDASLDEIARRAGVGAGTLYRHFPTREALLDSIMQDLVARVAGVTEQVSAERGLPRELLLAWFTAYVGLISEHRGTAAKITSAMGDPASPLAAKCQVLVAATDRILSRLRDDGAGLTAVDGVQVCRLVGGIAAMADQAGLDGATVRPLLGVVADGLLVRTT